MEKKSLNVVYGTNAKEPVKMSEFAGAYDVHSANEECITIPRFGTAIIPTNIAMEIPQGYIMEVKGRSGLAKDGIIVHNGTIDADYRGQIGVIIHNFTDFDFPVDKGMRIAQIKLAKTYELEFVECQELSETGRGGGGFGHSGK